jgi:ABC-2 type transport system ATP-binding protein
MSRLDSDADAGPDRGSGDGDSDGDGDGHSDRDGAPTGPARDGRGADTPSIETSGLTKRYGDVTAVDGLDLSVPPGTVYGFLGPNGAGKTTTMRMLVALVEPTAGEARVAGVPVADRDALVERIGYLPEEPPLFDELTGRENLEYVASLRDVPPDEAADRVDRLAGRLDVRSELNRRVSAYSTGMRQKVGVVAALVHRPDVVFMDEPTSGLDPRAARAVRESIVDLAAGDATVFLSTHVLGVVEAIADRVGVLHHGRLVAEGSPDELSARVDDGDATGNATLEDAFLAVTTERGASDGSRDDGSDGETAEPADDASGVSRAGGAGGSGGRR